MKTERGTGEHCAGLSIKKEGKTGGEQPPLNLEGASGKHSTWIEKRGVQKPPKKKGGREEYYRGV